MKNVRDHFDINLNYWEEFPEFKVLPFYSELYDSDTSRNKKKSNTIAWGIHLAYHLDSKFYNIPDKLDLIARDIIKDIDFDWSQLTISNAIEIYKKTVLTVAEQSLNDWNETMMLRTKGLKEWYKEAIEKEEGERDLKFIESLDKQMANTAKFFGEHSKILRDLKEETEGKKTKIKSESESDDF